MTAATYVQWLQSAALSNDAIRKEAMREESGNRGFTNPAADQLVRICASAGVTGTTEVAKMTGVAADIISRAKAQIGVDLDLQQRYVKAYKSKEAKRKADEREARMRKVVKIIARLTKDGKTVRTKDVAEEACLAWGTVRNYCRELWDDGRIEAEYDNRKHMTIHGVVK